MVHLLRNMPPRISSRPRNLEAFFKLAATWHKHGGLAGLWTTRRPKRIDDLRGGSVYLAVKGETVFRMPFVGIERVGDFAPHADEEWQDAWAIVCRPETILVEARRVYRLQGWRYLTPEDAPADIGEPKNAARSGAATMDSMQRDAASTGRAKGVARLTHWLAGMLKEMNRRDSTAGSAGSRPTTTGRMTG